MSTPNSKKAKASKGKSTSNQLLDAAERLFAEHGIANVSVRAIVTEAGQRNESALHYHFGNRNGLIRALHRNRSALVRKRRRKLLDELLARTNEPSIREACDVLVRPVLALAQNDQKYRNYVVVFGQFLISTDRELTVEIRRNEADAVFEIGVLLRKLLPELDNKVFLARVESVARHAIMSLSLFAAKDGKIVGPSAEFFFHNLLDTLTAMLTAEVSEQTQKVLGDEWAKHTHPKR